jgi:RNA polymerase sigma-70 factor (ECF subfamily)
VASALEDVDAEAHPGFDRAAYQEVGYPEVESEVDSLDASLIELTTDSGFDDPPSDFATLPTEEARGGEGRSDHRASPAIGAMSDEELLEGIRAQSETHFAELYNRYFQRIYSFVYTRMRNHAEAEEVVQETFLAVFRSFERYRGQSSLLSWIYGIAKNTANNSIRRSISLNERIELADEEDLVPRSSLGLGTPGEQLDLHRFQDQLTLRLEGLADWQAEIFEMRHFENLSIPEISKRTTRSSDAVRSSLYRVKRIFFEAAQSSGTCASTAGEPS